MKKQEDLIKELLEKDKFTFIVLDACRFDYFASEYRDFLKGRLIKVRSPASNTTEWLNRCFSGYYDLTFISANPFINSKMSVRHLPFSYDARTHFKKIFDVWDWGWNDKLSTVHPQRVNEAFELHSGERTIVWYMQPHFPYIGKTKLTLPGPRAESGEFSKSVREMRRKFTKLRNKIIPWDISLLPLPIRKILDGLWREWIIGPSAVSPLIKMINYGEIDVGMVRKAYKDNLRLALEYASEIAKVAKEEVIMSGDHGDLLGERGKFFHRSWIDAPELREVPWFIAE